MAKKNKIRSYLLGAIAVLLSQICFGQAFSEQNERTLALQAYRDLLQIGRKEASVKQQILLLNYGLASDANKIRNVLAALKGNIDTFVRQVSRNQKKVPERQLVELRESYEVWQQAVEQFLNDRQTANRAVLELSRLYENAQHRLLISNTRHGDEARVLHIQKLYQYGLLYWNHPTPAFKKVIKRDLAAYIEAFSSNDKRFQGLDDAFVGQLANVILLVDHLATRLKVLTNQQNADIRFELSNSLLQLQDQGNNAEIGDFAAAIIVLSVMLLISLSLCVGFYRSRQKMQLINNELAQQNQILLSEHENGHSVKAYRRQKMQIIRASEEERVIAGLLKSSFEPMEVFMRQAGREILAQNWLKLEHKLAIWLKPKLDDDCIDLVSNINLDTAMVTFCREHLLRDYLGKKPRFKSTNQPIHQVQGQHVYYAVPILQGEGLLGFILFCPLNSEPVEPADMNFFKRISEVIGIGVARKFAEQKIEYLAYHDALTHLPNRLLLLDRLEQLIALEQHHNRFSALIYIDLDRFKHINDSLGHPVGDALLVEFSSRLKSVIRHEDTLACLGGNEFIIVMADIIAKPETAARDVQFMVQKIQQSVAHAFYILGHKLFVTFSAGIVLITSDKSSPVTLLKQAHTAMHQAKAKGSDSISFFKPEMQAIIDSRMEMEKDLRLALERNELEVYYQPQVNDSGTIIAAEALLRWKHKTRGFVSPVEFIPIAEDAGLILEIGVWVLQQVCLQINSWQPIHQLKHIAVNVSPVQFRHPDFVNTFTKIMHRTQVDPNKLLFELTEGILVESVEEVIMKMQALKDLGVHFSIDDFGTGYSSLTYLKRFPLDQIKIDKSFVDDIGNDENNQVLIETIIAMTDRMGFSLIAEGVETKEQLKFLKDKGCQLYQGFYFNRPMPAHEFSEKC